jgi:hypothetical protein
VIVVLVLIAIVLSVVAILLSSFRYLRARATRVVHCPATGAAAAVELALFGTERLRIHRCTLWPRRECRQACRREIARARDGCTFDAILATWFRRQDCVRCARPIAPPSFGAPRPGLLSPEGRVVRWTELDPAAIFDTIGTHRPMCARCVAGEAGHTLSPLLLADRRP